MYNLVRSYLQFWVDLVGVQGVITLAVIKYIILVAVLLAVIF